MQPPLFFLLLAFGAQVVLSAANKEFTFSIQDVKQCQPVFLNFTQGNLKPNTTLPSRLTLLPFDSKVVQIDIPAVNVTDGGISLSFIPLPADTSFIASLDDSSGENAAPISDITRVQTGGSSDCFSSSRNGQRAFTLQNQNDTLSQPRQCENFTVKYNKTVSQTAPTVRIYSPKSAAYELKQSSDDGQGNAQYVMRAGRGAQYVLLFDNGNIMETSPLLTVGGDSGSSTDCFGVDVSKLKGGAQSAEGKSGGLNQNTVIGLAIGGGVVALIASVMVAYLVWERRHRRRVSIRFDPSMMEKRTIDAESRGTTSPRSFPPTVAYSPSNNGFVSNPPYLASQVSSPGYATTSESFGNTRRTTMNGGKTTFPDRSSPEGSLRSFEDIEGILNSQEQQLREEYEPESPMLSPASSMAAPTVAVRAVRAVPQRGHLRDPSDIPRAPESEPRSSAMSGNPFSDSNSMIAPFSEGQPSIGNMLQAPPPDRFTKPTNKSHFSAVTTSSFGGFEDSRISGVPNDVRGSSDVVDEMPQRRPLPSASGLGRGNGEPR